MQCLADIDPPAINPTSPVTPTQSPIQNPTNSPISPTTAPVQPTIPSTASPTITPSPTSESKLLSTTNALSAWDVFQGLSHLTQVNSNNPRSYALVAG